MLGFSALLHWLALGLVTERLRFPDWNTAAVKDQNVAVRLLTPPPAPAKAPEMVRPARPVQAKKPPKPRVLKASPPPAPPEPMPPPAHTTTPPVAMADSPAAVVPDATPDQPVSGTGAAPPVGIAAADAAAGGGLAAAQPDTPEPAPEPPPTPATTVYQVTPPPSVVLKYQVEALRDGQIVHGNGKITFQTDGKRYSVDGEAGILFFTVLNFRSSGEIDHWGISPVLYSEKRFRKAETATHFQRESKVITFSASSLSYPRVGGEQDRASLIWQLAGMGRGNASLFVTDASFDFFVAGVRDGESWRLRVAGLEEIETGDGLTKAWHVVRLPRPGSYEQQLDIWLAPQQQWFPVKLRFTEKNGEYLDMALSSATPMPPPAAQPVANAPADSELR